MHFTYFYASLHKLQRKRAGVGGRGKKSGEKESWMFNKSIPVPNSDVIAKFPIFKLELVERDELKERKWKGRPLITIRGRLRFAWQKGQGFFVIYLRTGMGRIGRTKRHPDDNYSELYIL